MSYHVNTTNVTRVLRSVWLNPGLSRVELSRRLDLNKSTVSKIVNYLEDLQVIEEVAVGAAGPAGGRRPIHLRIKPDYGCVMGIEVQTEAFTVVGVNLQGDLFFSHTEPLDLRRHNLTDALVDIISRFRPPLEQTGMPLLGVGVGVPGFVDPVRGALTASKPLEQYEEIEFAREARERLSLSIPVLADNDANCGCWGELAFKHSGRPDNFMFVLGELRKHTVAMDDYRIMAVGLGLVLQGELHYGANYSAGEFRSILHRTDRVNQFSVSDADARRFLHDPQVDSRIVEELAGHIAFLVNVLNLGKIVIGGPMEVLADELTSAVREKIQRNWAYPDMVECEISVSRLGEQAVAYGAAGMFLERVIKVPKIDPGNATRAESGIQLLPDVGREISI